MNPSYYFCGSVLLLIVLYFCWFAWEVRRADREFKKSQQNLDK